MNENSDREDRVRVWNSGTSLDFAWYVYGDERQKRLHDERRGDPSSLAYRDLLMAALFEQLESGKLIAFGFRIAPKTSDGPVPIPPDTFDQRPPESAFTNLVSASGYEYERIKVLPGNSTLLHEDGEANLEPRSGAPEHVAPATEKPESDRRRPGRTPIGRLLDDVVTELLREDEGERHGDRSKLKDIMVKEREAEIRKRAQERFPELFPRETQPSRRKIIEAMQRAGLSRAHKDG